LIFRGTGGVVSPRASPRNHERANLALVVITITGGLLVDHYAGLAGQLAVGVWAWAAFFRILDTAPAEWRLPLYLCLIWSTAGEIFLSLVWGLYTYRLENVPFFIPPGHVLLFYFGLVVAAKVPRSFVMLVPIAAAAYAVFAIVRGYDTLSVPMIMLFLLCWLQPAGRRLYSVMLIAALAMELYGTWVGNWSWRPDVPYLGLHSPNPPLAAGAFYCALDVLVGLTGRGLLRFRRTASSQQLTALTS
jgi:cellobiose-specific phosphotransferase system component IIC